MFKFLKNQLVKQDEMDLLENDNNEEQNVLLNNFDILNTLLENDNARIGFNSKKEGFDTEFEYEIVTYTLNFKMKSFKIYLKKVNVCCKSYFIERIVDFKIAKNIDNYIAIFTYEENDGSLVKMEMIISNVTLPEKIIRENSSSYVRDDYYNEIRCSDCLKFQIEKQIDFKTKYNYRILDVQCFQLNNDTQYCLLFCEEGKNYDISYTEGGRPSVICDLVLRDNELEIHNVKVPKDKQKQGIGTNAFNMIFKYIDFNKNINMIEGKFSNVDDDQADLREHFYRKFGITIKGNYASRTFDRD